MSSRIRLLLSLAGLLLVAASCERLAMGPEIAGELRDGRRFASGLIERERTGRVPPGDPGAIVALGYLERERLGMGSPFRIIDYALHDPRLDDSTRRALGWALLARTLDGDDDAIAPSVLDSLGGRPAAVPAPAGAEQLQLIARALRAHDDPRAGELAVRIAYSVAAAAHAVAPHAPLVAADVAVQLRDRALARQDARSLLRSAFRTGEDPLLLLPAWRASRAFAVERAVIAPLPPESEREALEMVPGLVTELEALGPEGDRRGAAPAPLIGASAPVLAALAREADAPPRAAIVVTVGSRRLRLLHGELSDSAAYAVRAAFVASARDEESLAAAHALAAARAPGIALERATLAAAVALRADAQETPWFPGDGGPSVRDLARRYGIVSVTFDASVPERNRPYYRRMLASALDDLRRVLPSLDVTGLRVDFSDSPLGRTALAMHDPRRRILYLPPGTAEGAIAHELAHDVDWQAARRRYDVGGDYATDRAMRDASGTGLAASLRGLTEASLGAAAVRDAPASPSSRPTEVFARSVDWLTAAALGRDGRLNGYLTSVQDGLLSGYVSVTPPDAGGGAAVALVHVLDDVSPLDPDERAWYLARFGPGRRPDPYEMVRRVLRAPVDSTAAADSVPLLTELVAPLRRTVDSAAAMVRRSACDAGEAADGASDDVRRLEAARLRVLELAARSRAMGILRTHGSMAVSDALWSHAAAQAFAPGAAFVGECAPASGNGYPLPWSAPAR